MHVQIRKLLKSHSNPQDKIALQRFFKTGKGQYGEGDIFIGVKMPAIKQIEKQFRKKNLISSEIHEERRLALLFMTNKYQKCKQDSQKKDIIDIYLKNLKFVNNWDLVDVSAPHILGQGIIDQLQNKQILYQYVKSDNLWKRRISIVSTFQFIKKNSFQDTLKLSKILLDDKQDLIHKACGWMLREMGKKDEQILLEFLDEHCTKMSRVMLRYSIEKLDQKLRKYYLNKKLQLYIQYCYFYELRNKSRFFYRITFRKIQIVEYIIFRILFINFYRQI